MILSFADKRTSAVFAGRTGKGMDSRIARAARRKLQRLDVAAALTDLRDPPGNRLERLHGDRADQWSIRVNDQWRICFRWREDGAHDVELVDYHEQAAEKVPMAAVRSENDRRRGGVRASAVALCARTSPWASGEACRSFSPHPPDCPFWGTEHFSALRASLAARDAPRHRPNPGEWAPSSYPAPKIATVAAVATFSAAC